MDILNVRYELIDNTFKMLFFNCGVIDFLYFNEKFEYVFTNRLSIPKEYINYVKSLGLEVKNDLYVSN